MSVLDSYEERRARGWAPESALDVPRRKRRRWSVIATYGPLVIALEVGGVLGVFAWRFGWFA